MAELVANFALLFDGETHAIEAGDDFVFPSHLVLNDWEEDSPIEPLLPFESAPIVAEWVDRPAVYSGKIPNEGRDAAWGGLSIALHSLCDILQGKSEAYQYNRYDATGRQYLGSDYTFRYVAEDGFAPEGKL